MLPVLYLVFLCSNFLLTNAEDNGNLNIEVKNTVNCTMHSASYTFTEGQNVTLVVQSEMYINYGWWNLITPTGRQELYNELKTFHEKKNNTYPPTLYTRLVNKSMAGTWEFKFYFFKHNSNYYALPRIIHTDNENYTVSVCTTDVTIVPRNSEPLPSKLTDHQLFIIACSVGAVLVLIIIAQTAYIVFLLRKARKLITLNTHNNLSKKSDSVPNDRARYCSNPGQKIMKEPIPTEDDNRDSVIYEAPNIEITNNNRMPMQPPQPPAIATMPRTPRPDHNMRIGPQAMLASAMNSPARSPMSMSDTLPPNFQRLQHTEREVNVANRPKLPLPNQSHPHHDAMFQEVYEEMETTADNTYEPPPVVNTMPPRLPMPPKKVPTGNLLDVKENTLKSRKVNKPQVTPKPQPQRPNNVVTANEFEQALRRRNESTLSRGNPGHMMHPQPQELAHRRKPTGDAPTNELEEVLRRRNNVMQVPIQSIPDPSSRSSPKPKPPPAQKPPAQVRHPVQEEIYYNEASSDEEEWTYEPLKPLNSYDPNIYNI